MFYISIEPFALKDPKAPPRQAIKSKAMQSPLTWAMAARQPPA